MPRQTKAMGEVTAGKRHPLNMRTTKEVRERLESAAAVAGRSLAQEVEVRLNRSFADEAAFSSADLKFWAIHTAGTFEKAARFGRGDVENWISDADAYTAGAIAAISSILQAHPDRDLDTAFAILESVKGRLVTAAHRKEGKP